MSGALMNKVWDLFGMDSAEPEGYEDENIYDYDNNEEEETEDNKKIFGRKNNKVVNMPQAQGQAIKMVLKFTKGLCAKMTIFRKERHY